MTIKRLGRGLADIIESSGQSPESFVRLRIDQIRTGRFQPRTRIDDAALQELKASIQRQGVIEPVIVRPIAHGTYELVAGERRLRASQQLGMSEVPSIIKTLSDKEALECSLVENLQREELSPMDEAKGYEKLLSELGYTQEQIAEAVGKDRATVANVLRLLSLPEDIQQGVGEGTITMGHAKALLSLQDHARQRELYRRIIKEGLSVRQAELIAGGLVQSKRRRLRPADPQVKGLEDELQRAFGTKVRVATRKTGGRIIVEYFSREDLTRILRLVGVSVGDG